MKIPLPYLVAGGAVLAALLWFAKRGSKGTGAAIGGAVVDLADGVVSGVVVGAGELVGLPATDKGACQRCIDEFRAAPWYQQAYLSFKVSANCQASDYLRFIGTGKGPQDA
ncbi:MAG: hypothetical protein WB542_18180 [Polaromonas sp.]